MRTVGDLMAPETPARPVIGVDEDVLRICLLPDLRAINWVPGMSEPGGRRP